MHHCHATGCKKPVPPEMFMCKSHWRSLPWTLKKRIWGSYRIGQCDDWNPSKEYCKVAKESVIFLAQKDGLAPDTELYDMFLRQ